MANLKMGSIEVDRTGGALLTAATGGEMGARHMPRRHPRWKSSPDLLRRTSVPCLATVKRVPRTRLVPGAVVWAHVPYEDGEGEKTRPAVVVELRGRDLTILPGTTSKRRLDTSRGYVEVRDLAAAGLNRSTGVRTSSVTIDIIEVIGVVGRLGEADLMSVLGPQSPGRGSGYADCQVTRLSGSLGQGGRYVDEIAMTIADEVSQIVEAVDALLAYDREEAA
jgi:hypothetical protein